MKKKIQNLSLVEKRILLATSVFVLLTSVCDFALVALELFNVAFNYRNPISYWQSKNVVKPL